MMPSITEVLAILDDQVSANRLSHMRRVSETARDLAVQYGADPTKAALAGLLHDYAKERPDKDFLEAIETFGLDSDLKNWGNDVWHGFIGSYLIETELGISDQDILKAVRYHTTGRPGMSLLEKIVYIADYIEPGRDFPGVEVARELVAHSLDQAVAYETAHTIAYLAQKGMPIYPKTLETYNSYCQYMKGL